MTYAELEQQAQRVAAALTVIGIGPGEHVALSCPKLP
jgi:non-ribosomal peptide synthetase component E (peptide arylation enzyme)